MQKCFDTEKRIRLGIWGLGRGSSFIKAANAVNIDIVAGCDYSKASADSFGKLAQQGNPARRCRSRHTGIENPLLRELFTYVSCL